MKRLLLVVALAATSLPLTAAPCLACSCAGRMDGQSEREYRHQAARQADVVFTGRVWRIEGDYSGGGGTVEAHFFVEEAYKGTRRHRVTVSTSAQGTACGFYFRRGARYTVFGYGDGPRSFDTNSCTETRRGRIDPDRYGL